MKPRYRARFRLIITLQVVLLVITIAALVYAVFTTGHTAVPIVLGVVVVLQVVALLHSVEAHVETLQDFFASINYEDFTRRFIADDVDAELKDAFNRILERFQDSRAERDLQANYLETVVRHVPVPFFAAKADGSLSLVNNPARRLTGMPNLGHLDELAELDAQLPALVRAIRAGDQQLLQTRIREVPVELRVSVSEIRMAGETERLYSIENLSGELTERETSAWRNLIRVLTHEIMNTLTPVTSLANTCESLLDDEDATEDIRSAVSTIARRSDGLMRFVSKYRELLHIPQPNPETFSIRAAVDDAVTLLKTELNDIDVEVGITPESLELVADRTLFDQLLLNIVKNAVSALESTTAPRVRLLARLNYGRTVIQVQDNGPGIPDSVLDQVFVPFFTTKRDGSGIGLSLSRQIMIAHGGEIAIKSDTEGTTISLVF